jgi:hypothetical protein
MREPGALRAFCAAAAMAACGVADGLAQPLQLIPPLGGTLPEQLLFYSGFDLWHFGIAGYDGMQWAPRGLNRDGFVLSISTSANLERYDTPVRRYWTMIYRAQVLPGWRFKHDNLEIKVFGGIDAEYDRPIPRRPDYVQRGVRFGARAAADIWWEPTAATMVSSSFFVSTIANTYGARAAAGWRAFDACWIGPEISISSDKFSTQYRAGLHVTALRTGAFEWSFGGGYVQDSFDRTGVYGRIGIMTRR